MFSESMELNKINKNRYENYGKKDINSLETK